MKLPVRIIAMAATVIAIAFAAIPLDQRAAATPKAEDDFQIVRVADGVYAAIAKSGGLASGNAGFVVGNDGVLGLRYFLHSRSDGRTDCGNSSSD